MRYRRYYYFLVKLQLILMNILQVTKTYELLNYSEYGTEVNGQIYSCDFTEYPQLNENRVQDINGFYKNIRNIIDKKRGVTRIDYNGDPDAM